jgi:hypothetical protein
MLGTRAQAEDSNNRLMALYGSVGLSDPNGSLAGGAEFGFYGLTRIGYLFSERIQATLGVDYHSFALDASEDIALSGKKFTAALLSGGIKVHPGDFDSDLWPFLIGGGGLALVDLSDTLKSFTSAAGTISADSDLRPFMEFGGGFEIEQFQVLVKMVNVFLPGSDARFLSFGIGAKLFL